jgi:hypothetical protein
MRGGMSGERELAGPYVLRGVVAVAAVLAALAVGTAVEPLVDPAPPRLESIVRCLESERGLATFAPPDGSPAAEAAGGAVQSIVEGNRVTIAVAGSAGEAERLEAALRDYAGSPGRVERRGDVLYAWGDDPSPTQRQVSYDCTP